MQGTAGDKLSSQALAAALPLSTSTTTEVSSNQPDSATSVAAGLHHAAQMRGELRRVLRLRPIPPHAEARVVASGPMPPRRACGLLVEQDDVHLARGAAGRQRDLELPPGRYLATHTDRLHRLLLTPL
jgi:hypothetical protein